MEKETTKLLNVLRRIARAAGYAAWAKSDPQATQFCIAQYNKVLMRIGELEPAVKPLFTSLQSSASAEVVRIAARELLAYFDVDAPEAFAWTFRGPVFGWHARRGRGHCFSHSVSCE